jgi:hypothetical protein
MGERADYMREWRRRNPAAYSKERAANAALSRALHRLGAMYPNVLERLVNEERAADGLPALYTTPAGRPRRRAS